MNIAPVEDAPKPLRKVGLIFAGLLAVLYLSSCDLRPVTQYSQTYDEQEYTKALWMADSISIDYAMFYVDSLHSLLEGHNPLDEWKYLLFKYDMARRQHQVDEALALTDSMMAKVQLMRGHPLMAQYQARTFLHKGDIYSQHLGLYDDAYHFYAQARLIGVNMDDACLIGEYDSRFGLVLYMKERYEEAAEEFKKAFDVLGRCQNTSDYTFYHRQRLLDDVGISYAKLGRHDSAMVYYEKTLEFVDRFGPAISYDPNSLDLARAVVRGNQAQSHRALGNFAAAESLFRMSIATNSQVGFDQNDALLTRLHLANMYLELGRDRESLQELMEVDKRMNVIRYLPHVRNVNTVIRWYDGMSRYHEKQGNYRQALEYRNATEHLKDSVLATNMNLYELNAAEEYNRVANQYEIDILKAEGQLRQTYLQATLAVSVMLVMIVVLVVYIWRKSRQNVALLTQLNTRIGEQKNRLEETVAELKVKSEEKDRILWMVAHDLRNPLGAIYSLSELVLTETDEGERQDCIRQIRFASTNALSLISDIMSTAKSETGALSLVPTELNELLYRVANLMRFNSDEKKQEIIVESTETNVVVPIDPEKMVRVVSNLVGNAIKFSPPGSKIWVCLQELDDHVLVHVVDRGIGIPEEMQERIFDTFTTAKRAGTQGERPFGLGLSIARQMVRAHGGDLYCESEEGVGSRFVISLPK